MASVSRVIIIGAGIGGICCAIACRRAGLQTVLLEKADRLAEVGAGIQIPPNAARVLNAFELLPSVMDHAITLESIDMKRYDNGKLLISMPCGQQIVQTFGAPWMVIHWPTYIDILYREARRLGATFIFGSEVKDIDVTRNIVTLKNGGTHSGDVIVGADGIWSSARECVLGHASPPTATGDLAYRATLSLQQLQMLQDEDVEKLYKQPRVTTWLGPHKHTVFYPVQGGKLFNLVLLRPDNMDPDARTTSGNIGEMRDTFCGWDKVLNKIISQISTVLKWKLMHHEELESWTRNRIVLLGDACHPTLPYQAQGAAMAVEDGAVLGQLLGLWDKLPNRQRDKLNSKNDAIPALLKLFERLRKQRTTVNVKGAIVNRHFYHMEDGTEQERRDREMAAYAGEFRTSEYKFLDAGYQKALHGHDSLGEARKAFDAWLEERILVPSASI